jgi:hypothetical protein
MQVLGRSRRLHTIFGAWHKLERNSLLFSEEPVVRTEPRAILRVRPRVLGDAAEAHITTDCAQIATRRVDDIKYFLQYGQLLACCQKVDKESRLT